MKQIDLQEFLLNRANLRRATPLLAEDGLRLVLLHLNAGEQIPEHRNRGAITVHCLHGEVSFFSGSQLVDMKEGVLISLPPNAPHRLSTQQESLLLLSMTVEAASD